MKKNKKFILIIILILVGIVLVDTLQAIIFKNNPYISWEESLADNDSWVIRGLLIDTYHCTKEKDIVTVSYKFKTSNFTCPIDNIDEINDAENVTMVIKDGTLSSTGATVIITDLSGKDNVYGNAYRIDKKVNGEWTKLKPIIDSNAWNSIGYSVGKNNRLELEQNWELLYGKLNIGKYRIVKSTSIPLEKENHYFSAEFEIK